MCVLGMLVSIAPRELTQSAGKGCGEGDGEGPRGKDQYGRGLASVLKQLANGEGSDPSDRPGDEGRGRLYPAAEMFGRERDALSHDD